MNTILSHAFVSPEFGNQIPRKYQSVMIWQVVSFVYARCTHWNDWVVNLCDSIVMLSCACAELALCDSGHLRSSPSQSNSEVVLVKFWQLGKLQIGFSGSCIGKPSTGSTIRAAFFCFSRGSKIRCFQKAALSKFSVRGVVECGMAVWWLLAL